MTARVFRYPGVVVLVPTVLALFAAPVAAQESREEMAVNASGQALTIFSFDGPQDLSP